MYYLCGLRTVAKMCDSNKHKNVNENKRWFNIMRVRFHFFGNMSMILLCWSVSVLQASTLWGCSHLVTIRW